MSMRHVSDRPSDRWQLSWLAAVSGLTALAHLGSGSGVTLADSGDFTLSDAGTVYTIPPASCNTLQTALQTDPATRVELILACRIAGRPAQPGPNDTPCDVVTGQINGGLALGQCLTPSFPTPALVVDPASGVLEANTNIQASAAGLNLALGDRDQISVTAVAGGVGNVLGLVDVQTCSDPSGATCSGPPSCGPAGIPVVASETACNEVSARLADSVVPNPPPLSHVLFFDVDRTGTNGLLKVAVCSGYKWSCRAPGTTLPNTTYVGQVPFNIVNTPATASFSRLRICLTKC